MPNGADEGTPFGTETHDRFFVKTTHLGEGAWCARGKGGPEMQDRRHSRRATVRLVALVAAGLTQARSVRPATAVEAVDYCPSDEERAFLTHLNAFRQANGLGSLRISRTLGAAAGHHSADMAARAYFS